MRLQTFDIRSLGRRRRPYAKINPRRVIDNDFDCVGKELFSVRRNYRRIRLLKQFGGLQEVARAGVEDLARVNGISPKLAQQIYDTFHADGN